MRALSALLMALVALVGGTATAHAETFGVTKHRTFLEVPVEHFVGYTDHADDGTGALSASASGALSAVQARASGTTGRMVLGAAAFGAVLLVQHAAGLDPDGAMLLADTVTLASIGETVDKIQADQQAAIERQNELNAETEKGLRGEAEAREEMAKQLTDLLDKVDGVTTALNEVAQDSDRPGTGGTRMSAQDKAEMEAFDAYARKGERGMEVAQHATLTTQFAATRELSTDSLEGGGVFVPTQISDRILERTYELSPIRQHATVETISTGDRLEIPRESLDDDYSTGWVGERQDREETDAEAFGLIGIDLHEQYAEPWVTNRMLDDSRIDVEARLVRGVSRRYSLNEGIAFVTGDGEQKPLGYLATKALAEFAKLGAITQSGNATKITDWKVMAKAMTGLPSAYQEMAKWFWNRSTSFIAITFVDGEGRPLLNFDLVREGGPMQFLGHEVVHVDAMPAYNLTTEAYTTGDSPILFADMGELYTVVDRAGMATIRDNITKKGRTKFYTTRRVGGRPVQFEAGRIIRVGT